MLVLSRKVGQELVIGDNIRITVNRVGGSRVTLGIVAPDDVRIVRGELEPVVRSFEVTVDAEETASSDADEAFKVMKGSTESKTSSNRLVESASVKQQPIADRGSSSKAAALEASNAENVPPIGCPVDTSNTLTDLLRQLH